VAEARTRLHEAVVGYIEGELASGRLPVGGRLPGERALAERLGISRASVREGLRVLEAMGVVRTAVGSGPDSGAVVVADTHAGITAALRLHLATRTLPVADLVETRVLLEAWAARRAAERREPEPLADAERLLHAMDAPGLGAEAYLALDADFHVALARAAGNEVVAAVMAALRESVHGYVVAALPSLPAWEATRRRLRAEHHAVLDAVGSGAGDRAADLVTRHIRGFYAEADVGR
jgi:GntR family transcriptional regulator, transcriptional repressor for pyruvate dehydrogenase complex